MSLCRIIVFRYLFQAASFAIHVPWWHALAFYDKRDAFFSFAFVRRKKKCYLMKRERRTTGSNSTRLHRTCALSWRNFFSQRPKIPRERGWRKRGWYTGWLNLARLFPWANTRGVQCYVTRMYRREKSTYLTRYAIRYLDVSSDAPCCISFDLRSRFASDRHPIYTLRLPDTRTRSKIDFVRVTSNRALDIPGFFNPGEESFFRDNYDTIALLRSSSI